MAAALDSAGHRTTPALDLIDQALAKWADAPVGDGNKLMIFCPPQEGKSQKVSRRTPAWLLAHDPTLRIAIVSYAANKAERWGRQIRRDIATFPELQISLRPDSRAAGRWETIEGGQLICVGIDGGITGEPVDVLIIDDPVRGRAEAESITYRETAWDWWESNGSTRLSSRGRVCLMMTRWHEDDLAGRLLQGEPGEWAVVRIPAIAEDNDPLGRAPGEELLSVQKRQPGYFHRLKATRSVYVWLSIYMQTPTAAEGNLFRRINWRHWAPAPRIGPSERLNLGGKIVALADSWRFATIDLANSTRTSADYTVIAAWARVLTGDLVLLDMVRARIGEARHFEHAQPLIQRWQLDSVFVEGSQYGTTLVREAANAGIPITAIQAEVDKLSRALPYAAWVTQGRVWLPARAHWVDTWKNEHASFPVSNHDDMVDTGSLATRVAITGHAPAGATPPPSPEVDSLTSAIGQQSLDLMTVPM
ncbi:MAG TPA: phage terminase large subunit [Candidatus Limnocylindrales bacterium]